MVSIGALRYDIIADTSEFQKGIIATKKELRDGAKVMRETRTPTKEYGQELDRVRNLLKKGAISVDAYDKKIRKLKAQYAPVIKATTDQSRAQDRLNKEIQEYAQVARKAQAASQKRMQSMKSMTSETSKSAAGFAIAAKTLGRAVGVLGAGVSGIAGVKSSITTFMDVETAAADFKVLTGSAQEGMRIFEQLRTLAAETPLEFTGVTKAARTLMSFGVQARDTTKALQDLGDISGGNAERFQSLALAYGQVNAAGRLMGQDLLQMINAGFNPLLQISEETGRSMGDLKKDMENGAISFEMVERAIQSATGEGGLYNNRMNEMAGTTRGKLTIMRSEFSKFGASVGQALSPVTNMFVDAGNAGLSGLNKISEGLLAMGRRVRVIPPLVEDTRSLAEKIKDAAKETEKATEIHKSYSEALAAQRKDQGSISDEVESLKNRNLELTMGKEFVERRNILQSDASDAVKQELLRVRERNKELERANELEEDRKKAVEDRNAELKRSREEIGKEALQRAQQFFAEERQRQMERRKEVAAGPGDGMEVGSSEAARYLADQQNARIASSVPVKPTPGEDEIIRVARQQITLLRQEKSQRQTQIKTLDKILLAQQENGFRRIR